MLKHGVDILIYAGDADFGCNWMGNLAWVKALVDRGQRPFEWLTGDLEWARSPEPEERVTRTFCGT